jgi:hypothetical protein
VTDHLGPPVHRDVQIVARDLRPAYLPPDPASRTAEAISLHEQSLAGRERVLGPRPPGTLTARVNLAQACQAVNRAE